MESVSKSKIENKNSQENLDKEFSAFSEEFVNLFREYHDLENNYFNRDATFKLHGTPEFLEKKARYDTVVTRINELATDGGILDSIYKKIEGEEYNTNDFIGDDEYHQDFFEIKVSQFGAFRKSSLEGEYGIERAIYFDKISLSKVLESFDDIIKENKNIIDTVGKRIDLAKKAQMEIKDKYLAK